MEHSVRGLDVAEKVEPNVQEFLVTENNSHGETLLRLQQQRHLLGRSAGLSLDAASRSRNTALKWGHQEKLNVNAETF